MHHLRTRRGDGEGARELIHFLQLHAYHKNDAVYEALRRSHSHAEPSDDVVRRELERLTDSSHDPALPDARMSQFPSAPVAMGDIGACGKMCQAAARGAPRACT